MPLPHHPGAVSRGLESLGKRRFRLHEAKLVRSILHWARIEFMTKPLLIASGQQTGPSRTANRTGDVTRRESDAVIRDRVDLWRGNLLPAITAELSISQIVRHNNDNVGPFSRSAPGILVRGCDCARKNDPKQ